uniref:Uncharacterized protein n=1 Tax=Anopheles merus TaxID=30066 RepID=A0A182UMX6_ANOME
MHCFVGRTKAGIGMACLFTAQFQLGAGGWYVLMTVNIMARLNEPASELSKLRCAVGNSSPISRNGMLPNPIEKPIMNTIKLTIGRYPKQVLPIEFRWKAAPIDAIARLIISPDMMSNGLRPARSTTNRAAPLLSTCTMPTIIVAR